jgi:tripartite-type tricarboxylate transporter receptor subunit TctC
MTSTLARGARAAAALAATILVAPTPATAVDFTGKTIEMLVGADVAGGYDIYARAVARNIGRFIPGNPQILARNMPGAGSALAGAHMFRVAPKDGTTIGAMMPGAIMGRLLDERASTLFEPTKFNYIGTADTGTRVCITFASSPIKTYEDAIKHKAIMGASQAGGATRDYAYMHNHATNTLFNVVSGYKGTSDILLAMERGENDGLCGFDFSSLKSQKPDWLRDKKINILMQDALDPEPELTGMGVPGIWPFIKDDLDRKAVELVLSQQLFGRSYVLPPGTPQDIVVTLRDAFSATMRDKEFLADAEKLRIGITPSSGEKLQEVVARVHASAPEVVTRAKRIIEP